MLFFQHPSQLAVRQAEIAVQVEGLLEVARRLVVLAFEVVGQAQLHVDDER